MGPVVPDKHVKFGDPRSSCSREIPAETARSGIFDSFFQDNFRPEVVSDLISGLSEERFSMDVSVKFGDSWSNRSRDIDCPTL